ncbi:cas scaffolding protein family member 4 isoform X4 [Meriones unguiculatus]|uniref:cas scaffolding protein family member 4 isoform X4 n=1 Tax=Meriones unguiculatus TaxID=10047 RepID=UPI000B4F776A|nr:cas scaffolding protein family member 4 isoform X4 [Meriones unguiculatus]
MRGTSIREGAPKTLLARALYDNHPDCSDELAFSRGDILTIVDQNVPESEGWWKCLLHGRQGLAPANRLQVLKEIPEDRPCPLLLRGLDTDLTSSEGSYPVPNLSCPQPPGPVYEPMKSWVEGLPQPATAQLYELPDSPSSARIICEKTPSFPKQTLIVLPRPTRASLPTLPSQVYDVPVQRPVFSTLKPEKRQLYDIPTSSQKAVLHSSTSQASKSPHLQEKGRPILKGRSNENQDFGDTSSTSLASLPPSRQNPERKIHLSEHCRLYFGALFRAIGVLASSLSNSQPPEVFITQSKLVITVGQKLVDTLCNETQEKDERNEILRGSSHLCGLLKDLALATKNAVIKYPSQSALCCLQTEVEKLEHHSRKFRDTLE